MSMPISGRFAPAVTPRFAPDPVIAPQPKASAIAQDSLALSPAASSAESAVAAGGGVPIQGLFDQLHGLVQQLADPAAAPAPAVSSGGGSGPVLGVGNSGAAVAAMQQRLEDLGIDPGPVDGVFGPHTQVAVKAFQQQQGIQVDGVVGPETWDKLGIHVAAPDPMPADSKPSAGTFKEAANPADLVGLQGFEMLKGTAEAFSAMQAAARADGVDLAITSAYRSDAYQADLFKNAVAKYGSEAAARKWVAPPGNSQHRSGRALDLELSSGIHAWLSKNAARFGFYQPMSWEDWHWTYTGKARGSQG